MTRPLPFLHDLNWVKRQVLWLWIPSKDMISPNLFNAFFLFLCVCVCVTADSCWISFLRVRVEEMNADPRFIVVMNRKAAAFFDLSDMRSRVSSAYVKLSFESRRRGVHTEQPPKRISCVGLSDFDVSAHLVEHPQTNWLRLLCPSSSNKKKCKKGTGSKRTRSDALSRWGISLKSRIILIRAFSALWCVLKPFFFFPGKIFSLREELIFKVSYWNSTVWHQLLLLLLGRCRDFLLLEFF